MHLATGAVPVKRVMALKLLVAEKVQVCVRVALATLHSVLRQTLRV